MNRSQRVEAGPAVFSTDLRYRYELRRVWGGDVFEPDADQGLVLFVMLNPSTADTATLDPTLRRCAGFAATWGYAGMVIRNLFALRATDPAALYRDPDPIGPDNDEWLARRDPDVALTVVGWGVHGALGGRGAQVLPLLDRPHALRILRGGEPGHPLYLRGTSVPVPI